MNTKMRRHLSAPGLLRLCRCGFNRASSELTRKVQYDLSDCLMSGLAVFGLKYASLLAFDENRSEAEVRHNLRTLYGIKDAPCDTQLRERLDRVNPGSLKWTYKALFIAAQRGKVLPLYESLNGYYIVSSDGTGIFQSKQVHCENCCQKHHRDGSTSYYHQILSAVMVHPDQKQVIPLYAEPIVQQDGTNKNDCERNASKRLWHKLRAMHPNLKILAVEDGLYGNAPHIEDLQTLNMSYVIGVKPSDHKWLFDWVRASQLNTFELTRDDVNYQLSWINDVPLNDSRSDIHVNFIECTEINAKGKRQHFTWISDIKVTEDNVFTLMRIGRSRWKIENETFNTLKNQGYHFEHNFGHGYKHLSNVFAHLMLLAFAIDQLQQMCCPMFQAALKRASRLKYFWERLRFYCIDCFVDSWETVWKSLINRPKIVLTNDTS